jgi:hypothetical protein
VIAYDHHTEGEVHHGPHRTSTAAHRRRRIVVLENANWRCQIAREDRCTGRATVYDHRIAVKTLDLIPPAIRPTRAELDEPWNAGSLCALLEVESVDGGSLRRRPRR